MAVTLSIQPVCYAFMFSIFSSKIVRFFGVRLSVCFGVMSPQLSIEFSLFWNVLFCLYYFTLCRYLFNLPSFPRTFWFISSSCTVIFSLVVFSFLFPHILGPFCLTFWPIFVNFFICVSSRISHPGFDCFFVLFEGIPIFSHTNFSST